MFCPSLYLQCEGFSNAEAQLPTLPQMNRLINADILSAASDARLPLISISAKFFVACLGQLLS